MKRFAALFFAAAICVVAGYLLFPRSKNGARAEERREYTEYAARTKGAEGLAPVQLWGEAPPDVKSNWRAARTARLVVTRGQAFFGDRWIPSDEICQYLDAKIAKGEIDYVLVSAAVGAKWGEIVPVVSECRKSRVKIVLLNLYEA
jgi:hypothetical protein